MKKKSTRLYGYPVIGDGRIVIEFNEAGWHIVEDSRSSDHIGGYLHIGDDSADEITEAVRDNIIKYMYQADRINSPQHLPGVGATPQHKYMKGLSIDDLEAIGNDGKRAFYA